LKKTIFTYWHQGFEQAPEIVKACARVIESHHPDWDIHFLDARTVDDWIDPMPIPREKWERLQLAHRSDLIRTQLLLRHGGVWADPTIWFCRPLDDWLPEQMEAGLFFFSRPGPDRIISNWFIASEKGGLILDRLYERLCRYWTENEFLNLGGGGMSASAKLFQRISRRSLDLPRLWLRRPMMRLLRAYPYMVYHYMLYDLICSDADCQAVFGRMPKVSADGPHRLLRYGLDRSINQSLQEEIETAQQPLYKLTWKLPRDKVGVEDSVLRYLFRSSDAPEAVPLETA
jgi:hypothetical protein